MGVNDTHTPTYTQHDPSPLLLFAYSSSKNLFLSSTVSDRMHLGKYN